MLKKLCILFTAFISVITFIQVLNNHNVHEQRVRDVTLQESEFDHLTFLESFDNVELIIEDYVADFRGYMPFDPTILEEFDNLSYSDQRLLEENDTVRYHVNFDAIYNIITISAEMTIEGALVIDEISGVTFINEYGQLDAVLNVEYQGILLSELIDTSLIQLDFLRRVASAVAAVAVVAVAVAVVVVAAPVVAKAAVAVAAKTSAMATTAGVAVGGANAIGVLAAGTLAYAAVLAGTAFLEEVLPRVYVVLERFTYNVLIKLVDGIEYAMQMVTEALINNINRGHYFLAHISKRGNVFITSTRVERAKAVNHVSLGGSIYTFHTAAAKSIAYEVGNFRAPIWESAHRFNKDGSNRLGIFFNHWHTFEHGKGHAFYGIPFIFR